MERVESWITYEFECPRMTCGEIGELSAGDFGYVDGESVQDIKCHKCGREFTVVRPGE